MTTDAASADGDCRLPVVTFRSGDLRFALEGRHVLALHPDHADGTARVHDMEALLALPRETRSQGACRLLMIRHPGGEFPLRVPEPVEFTTLPCGAVHPLPPLIGARSTTPALRALYLEEDGVTLIIDPTAFAAAAARN